MPTNHYFFVARDEYHYTAFQHLRAWLGADMWGVRKGARYVRQVTTGDRICLSADDRVVAKAEIAGPSSLVSEEEWPGPNPWRD